LHFFG